MSVYKGADRAGLNDDSGTVKSITEARVGTIENVGFTGYEQRRQQARTNITPIFFNEVSTSKGKLMPGPQILGKLIDSMGGAGTYPGPGQVINTAV